MRLYLVRHGAALSARTDSERPLSPEGVEQVESVARQLRDRGARVAKVVHSPKRRAAETARILAAVVAPGTALEVDASLVPEAEPDEVAAEVGTWEVDALLAGHLPHMERLCALLVTGRDVDPGPVRFRTGTLAILERDGGAPSGWRLLESLTP